MDQDEDLKEDPKADWICHRCGKANHWHMTTCANPPCSTGWAKKQPPTHEAICEKCKKPSILPLVHVGRSRGVLAIWGVRSINIFHIRREYRAGLEEGMWVCTRCASPDMSVPVDYGQRVCLYCGDRLRSTNPKMWCEKCHVNEKADRECKECGKRLSSLEYLFCARCGSGKDYPTYYKPMLAKGMLDTNRPMKAGPGGIKSRNRAGLSLMEIEEEIRRETMRHTDRRRTLLQKARELELQASGKETLASTSGDVEALVLRNEAAKLRELLVDVEIRIKAVDRDLRTLHEATASAKEVHTWRLIVPGQFSRPKYKSQVRNASKFYPLMDVSDNDLDAERLDPIRMKPPPPFTPIQDLELRKPK